MTDINLKMQNCERAANSTNKTNVERKEDWITSAEDFALTRIGCARREGFEFPKLEMKNPRLNPTRVVRSINFILIL